MAIDLAELARRFGGTVGQQPAAAPAAAAAAAASAASAAAPAAPDMAALAAQMGGQVAAPAQPAPAPPEMGFLASIREAVTGTQRARDPEVAAALREGRTIYDMPESNRLSFGVLKAAAGGLMASSEERAKIFQANFPGTTYRVNPQGVVFLRSPTDGREYVIEPGITLQDIPRIVGTVAAFGPAGRATTIPGAIAAGAGTQAAIETTQAAAGGQFSPAEVAIAGATGPVGVIAQRGTAALRQRVAAPAPAPRVAAAPAPRVEPPLGAPSVPPAAAPAAAPIMPPAPPPLTVAGAPSVAPAAGPMTITGTIAPTEVSEILTLARKASRRIGGASARAQLADLAQVNPEAAQAAQRLGIDVPFDVLSDNPQVRNAVGLTRALVAGEAEAAWESSVRGAIQRADEISQQFDAAFVEGRPAVGVTSQRILDSLKGSRDSLEAQAKAIYSRLDGTDAAPGVISRTSPVELNTLRNTLDQIVQEVGEGGMTAQEKRLLSMLRGKAAREAGEEVGEAGAEAGLVTYGRLLREKNLIGKALEGKESPYGNMDSATLKRLYGALAQDQLDNVGALGGEEARRELRAANLLVSKRKALEKRIVAAFGEDMDGSLATKMQTAIRSASLGDAAAFNKLMKAVPEDLRRETVATALASVTASKRGTPAGGGFGEELVFGFNDFAKTYRGLRSNPPVYSQMVKIMGPEWDRAMRDLYEVSRRIADAQSRIPTTGKANQILGESAVTGLIGRVMQTGAAQRITTSVAGGLGPLGGALAPDIIEFMRNAPKAAVQKAGDLFASPEFQRLAVETASQGGAPSDAALRAAARSKAFKQFADAVRIPVEPDARIMWLQNAIQAGRTMQAEPTPQEQP